MRSLFPFLPTQKAESLGGAEFNTPSQIFETKRAVPPTLGGTIAVLILLPSKY
jgi:hypothetical protein